MIPKGCKRLAEVDFPIAVVSKHAATERREGHPSTLHLWWARRPLAACRAMLMALLLPDPCDEQCPESFRKRARALLPRVQGKTGAKSEDLRNELLRFIGDFANWDLSTNATYLEVARGLVSAAHPGEVPLVVDPFAGGGSIPLEALRLGCDAFSSDLNQVACLIQKATLEDIPAGGGTLSEELQVVGAEIRAAAEKDLSEFYPLDGDGARPMAYLWARVVRCESPRCGAEIPLLRSFWLCKKAKRRCALKHSVVRPRGDTPRIEFEIFHPKKESEVVPGGTVTRAKASCLACGVVLPPDRLRVQLSEQRGGADVTFDAKGERRGGARLLAVATLRADGQVRHYRLATSSDYRAVFRAQQRLLRILEGWQSSGKVGLCPVPDEPIIQEKVSRNSPFRMHLYGCDTFGDLTSARQKLSLILVQARIRDARCSDQARRLLALALGDCVRHWSAFAKWHRASETVAGTFALQAISMAWDYPEMLPFSDYAGGLNDGHRDAYGVSHVVGGSVRQVGTVQRADAARHPLPDSSVSCWFTDPPYYDAIPYADLSDVFFVWHRRTLPNEPILGIDKLDLKAGLTPKALEIVQDDNRESDGTPKDRQFFERAIAAAFTEGRRELKPEGIACVVFAHKTTEGWEALLQALINGGWVVTSSWPIATERGARLRARESAALATSIHLVCRPRPEGAGVGEWSEVLRALPPRVTEWMGRLQKEGVRGADLVFACIGPALEVFSRYERVETAEGREVKLAEYLEKVWEVVGRSALEEVLGTGGKKSDAASALEEDSRLTALFLWTLQSTELSNGSNAEDEADEDVDSSLDDEEDDAPKGKKKGLTLIYDVVRRFAQPLGIHLEGWEKRIIETNKGVVRLLPVAERAEALFGEEGASGVARTLERGPVAASQLRLFPDAGDAPPKAKGGRRRGAAGGGADAADDSLRTRQEATTLDRVHAAMLLQRSGKANALRALLTAEVERGPSFLRLANGLTALYPRDSEEKRLLDAMLLAVPRN